MTAPTGPSARHTAAPTTYAEAADPTARPADAGVTGSIPPQQAPAPAPARRTVSMRVAAIIAVVAFLVGVGISMLLGPVLGGGPGGPGGPNGQGGPPGTSTSQTQTGTAQTGTAS